MLELWKPPHWLPCLLLSGFSQQWSAVARNKRYWNRLAAAAPRTPGKIRSGNVACIIFTTLTPTNHRNWVSLSEKKRRKSSNEGRKMRKISMKNNNRRKESQSMEGQQSKRIEERKRVKQKEKKADTILRWKCEKEKPNSRPWQSQREGTITDWQKHPHEMMWGKKGKESATELNTKYSEMERRKRRK